MTPEPETPETEPAGEVTYTIEGYGTVVNPPGSEEIVAELERAAAAATGQNVGHIDAPHTKGT